MKKEKLRKEDNKGITLIALVITIIVLLILAAVTIVTLTGENGILTKANEATQRNNQSKAEEEVKLAIGSLQIEERQRTIGQDEKISVLEKELKSLYTEQQPATTISVSEEGWLISHRGNRFKIDNNYNVSYLDSFNAEEWDKTACKESSFLWESDDQNSGEAYYTIIGISDEMQNEVEFKIPSRCHKIRCDGRYYSTLGRDFAKGFNSVQIPNTVITIGDSAFAGFELTELNLPDSVKNIGTDAFRNCQNLTSIVIPSSVTWIGQSAFAFCCNLGDIKFSNELEDVDQDAFSETLWYNEQPDGVVYTGAVAYKYKGIMPSGCKVRLREDTKGIGCKAFNWSNITAIEIPDGVNNIGREAFSHCTYLTEVSLPKSLRSIEGATFLGCSNLKSVSIGDDVKSIGEFAFRETSLESFQVPDGVTSFGRNVMGGTPWWNSQPNGIVYVGRIAYGYKGELPNNSRIELKEGTRVIAAYAFAECKTLESIKIPYGVENIGYQCFLCCYGLTEIELPKSLYELEMGAFWGCTGLSDIIIPKSVEVLGANAFYSWKSSQTICFEVTGPNLQSWSSGWDHLCNAQVVYGYSED